MGRQEFEGTFNYRKNVVLVIKVDPIWVVSVSFYYFLLFVYLEIFGALIGENFSLYNLYDWRFSLYIMKKFTANFLIIARCVNWIIPFLEKKIIYVLLL